MHRHCQRGCSGRIQVLHLLPTSSLLTSRFSLARQAWFPSTPVSGAAQPWLRHRWVQSIGDTIMVSLNCFFVAAAPGSKRLTIEIICQRAVDETLLIVSCKFSTGTSTFISHPGNNIPVSQTGRRGKDTQPLFCSTGSS